MLMELGTIVTPETLLAWHRRSDRAEVRWQQETGARDDHGTGRRSRALVVRLANENRTWGYRRIQGALANLGHEIGHSTIAEILVRNGIEPAPERGRKTTWKEFLEQHWALIVATDFFTIEVWTRRGLQRFIVLFFIELSTRKVQIAGIASSRERAMDEPGRAQSDR